MIVTMIVIELSTCFWREKLKVNGRLKAKRERIDSQALQKVVKLQIVDQVTKEILKKVNLQCLLLTQIKISPKIEIRLVPKGVEETKTVSRDF